MLIRLVAVVLGAMTLTACTGNRPLSREAYTREYAAALQKALPQSKVEVTAVMQLRVVGASSGNESTAFLDNSYAEYVANPKDKDAVFRRYVAAFAEPESTGEKVDPKRIVPVIKDRAWLEEIREAARAGGSKLPEMVFEPLNDQLTIVYAEDTPKNIHYLTPRQLEALGLKREQLRELAVLNLKALLPKIESHGENGVYMLTVGDDYEASLLLFDDIWGGRKLEVSGDYVVAIPSRDLLLVTGSGDGAGIAKVRELAKKATQNASYPLTPDLFVYRGGRFVRLEENNEGK